MALTICLLVANRKECYGSEVSGTKLEHFRITVWPGTVVPVPRRSIFALVGYRLDPTGTVLLPAWDDYRDRPRATNEAEGETYLRLAEIDLDDPEAILEFVNRFGILQIQESRMGSPAFALSLHVDIIESLWQERIRAGAVVLEELPRRWYKDSTPEQVARDDDEVETIADFRVGAALIRDAIKAWRWMNGTVDASDLAWESPEVLRDFGAEHRDKHAWLASVAVDELWATIDFALAPFHPSFSIGGLEDDEGGLSGPRVEVVPESGFTRSEAFLYSVCCLELYNHIVEQAQLRTCANETCGRLFVRQSGRAQQGQNRTTGVMYCTAHCAKAQAQRMYRRRKRASDA